MYYLYNNNDVFSLIIVIIINERSLSTNMLLDAWYKTSSHLLLYGARINAPTGSRQPSQ